MSILPSSILLLRYYAGFTILAVSHGYEMECTSRGESGPWVTPGTACRSYYTCSGGHPIINYCPANTFFNTKTKHCVSSGSCYEAVCTGREDGSYLDPTESCTRSYWCSGGRMVKVGPLTSEGGVCPSVSGSSAKLVFRPNRCKDKQNGRYNQDDKCSGFFECKAGMEISETICPQGSLFDGNHCNNQSKYCTNLCTNKKDGLHPDLTTGCVQYVRCSNGNVVERLHCLAETGFNGNSCVPQNTFFCPGTDPCMSLPDGFHLESCENYFKCEKGRTLFSAECSLNEYFDGTSCVPNTDLTCNPHYFSKICLGKDGFYKNHTSGCSIYYHCSRDGKKIDFTCPSNQLFNGSVCVSFERFSCPVITNSCEDKPEGYYMQQGSRCQAYYYCLNNNRIVYYCPKGMLYNGNKCVPASSFVCSDDLVCNDLSGPCS